VAFILYPPPPPPLPPPPPPSSSLLPPPPFKDPRAALYIEELLEPMTTSVVDPSGFIAEKFARDWSYQNNDNWVDFGHINEFLWLVIEACEVSKEKQKE